LHLEALNFNSHVYDQLVEIQADSASLWGPAVF